MIGYNHSIAQHATFKVARKNIILPTITTKYSITCPHGTSTRIIVVFKVDVIWAHVSTSYLRIM
jgi:hypothetical protein